MRHRASEPAGPARTFGVTAPVGAKEDFVPTYEYVCQACEHQFELFHSITADPLRRCPECRRLRLKRLIGPGAAIIFKGSGFYQTDYRSESYKKAAESERKKAEGDRAGASGDKAGDKASGKASGKAGESKSAKKSSSDGKSSD